ncbi:hypothetical protein [Comamonas sp. BIGb0124]|uniref:hypothetical protein n=1 Tax=Comamonas sp. BIGb0124 TaxID=2485130 RepID=UPI000F4999DB|nr:hypothetical protein [Comamonas sp. BIGb0124]
MHSPQTCSVWPGPKLPALLAAILMLIALPGCSAISEQPPLPRRSQQLTPVPQEISGIRTDSSSEWLSEASEALDGSELWLDEVSRWSNAETLKSLR